MAHETNIYMYNIYMYIYRRRWSNSSGGDVRYDDVSFVRATNAEDPPSVTRDSYMSSRIWHRRPRVENISLVVEV